MEVQGKTWNAEKRRALRSMFQSSAKSARTIWSESTKMTLRRERGNSTSRNRILYAQIMRCFSVCPHARFPPQILASGGPAKPGARRLSDQSKSSERCNNTLRASKKKLNTSSAVRTYSAVFWAGIYNCRKQVERMLPCGIAYLICFLIAPCHAGLALLSAVLPQPQSSGQEHKLCRQRAPRLAYTVKHEDGNKVYLRGASHTCLCSQEGHL